MTPHSEYEYCVFCQIFVSVRSVIGCSQENFLIFPFGLLDAVSGETELVLCCALCLVANNVTNSTKGEVKARLI
jgi:hypothetical protein